MSTYVPTYNTVWLIVQISSFSRASNALKNASSENLLYL